MNRTKTTAEILAAQAQQAREARRAKVPKLIPLAVGERFTINHFAALYRDHYKGADKLPRLQLIAAATECLWDAITRGDVLRVPEKTGLDQTETGVEIFQIIKKVQIQ